MVRVRLPRAVLVEESLGGGEAVRVAEAQAVRDPPPHARVAVRWAEREREAVLDMLLLGVREPPWVLALGSAEGEAAPEALLLPVCGAEALKGALRRAVSLGEGVPVGDGDAQEAEAEAEGEALGEEAALGERDARALAVLHADTDALPLWEVLGDALLGALCERDARGLCDRVPSGLEAEAVREEQAEVERVRVTEVLRLVSPVALLKAVALAQGVGADVDVAAFDSVADAHADTAPDRLALALTLSEAWLLGESVGLGEELREAEGEAVVLVLLEGQWLASALALLQTLAPALPVRLAEGQCDAEEHRDVLDVALRDMLEDAYAEAEGQVEDMPEGVAVELAVGCGALAVAAGGLGDCDGVAEACRRGWAWAWAWVKQ